MSIDKVSVQIRPRPEAPKAAAPLIAPEEVKAILYPRVEREISLPDPKGR